MRLLRVLLVPLLVAGPVQAQPVVDLLTRFAVSADETAALAPEGDAPRGSGQKLAELEANLVLVSEGLEAFAHPQDADKALRAAKPRLPAQIAPIFRDRAAALDSLYRTLAVVDYTWALRFPEPPCSPADRRAALLRSSSGLFVDPVSGRMSSWMETLLGPDAKGKSLEAALDQASASAPPSQTDYARLRARQKLITRALSSENATGKVRAKLYCQRAEVRIGLASANRTAGPILAARSSDEGVSRRGIIIVAGKNGGDLEVRGAGAVIDTPSGVRVLTDRRLGGGQLAALVEGKSAPVALSVEREDESSGLLLLRPEGDVGEATAWADAAPKKGDLVAVIAHSERLGAWTKSQGLVTSEATAQFQTDAVADASMTGGGVFDEEGRLAGLLVLRPAARGRGDWPAAVPAPALRAWASGGPAPEAGPASLEDAGTTKILTASRPLLDTLSVAQPTEARRADDIFTPTPWGTVRGRCMANCEIDDGAPSAGYSGGDGSRELGEALGKLAAVGMQALIFKGIPALFRGIGSLFKGKGNGSSLPVANISGPKSVKESPPPKPKPVPPKLTGLSLTLEPKELLEGEEIEAIATLSFSGDNPNRKDIPVSFSFQGKEFSSLTNAAGVASLTFTLDRKERDLHEKPFNDLDNEVRIARGEDSVSYLRPALGKSTALDGVKRRSSAAFSALGEEQHEDTSDERGAEASLASVEEDWADDETGPVEAASSIMMPEANSGAPFANTVALEKLYDFPVAASASAGSMGSANDSNKASVMSDRCPPGTEAADQEPPGGQSGQAPSAPSDKATLEKECRAFEEVANETCAASGAKSCRDTVLLLLDYNFRACLKRSEPDGAGSTGSIGMPNSPKPKRLPPSRRCVRYTKKDAVKFSGSGVHARSLGNRPQKPMSDAVKAAWRSLIMKLLAGARFNKNVKFAIFEVAGGYAKLSELFDSVTQGLPVDRSRPGIKTVQMTNRTRISLRTFSSGGEPTLQVLGPGGQRVKIRAP